MMLSIPSTVGVAPGTFTMQLGWPNTDYNKPCPTNPTGWYITDPFTNSVNPAVGFPADHAVGYYPNSLGDASTPTTVLGLRLDILALVTGVALATAFVIGKLAK